MPIRKPMRRGDIRNCARDKEIEYCSLCDDFPCKKLIDFTSDRKPHHADAIENLILINKIGKQKWLEVQKEKWTCKCNAKYSWYLTKCAKCNE